MARSVVLTRVGGLNTPKSGPVTDLFKVTLGVEDIKANWTWHRNPLGTPAEKLNAFVSLRGSIAHGEQQKQAVTLSGVRTSYDLVERIANCVEEKLQELHLLPEDEEISEDDAT